jgi:hypothetical protein
MADTERQNAAGKVLRHFTMSLDGFVAGPNHAMDWVTGLSIRPRLVEEYAETTGAVLGGRDGFDAYPLSAASTVARGRGLYSSLRTIPKRAAHQRRDFPELRCGRGDPDRA